MPPHNSDLIQSTTAVSDNIKFMHHEADFLFNIQKCEPMQLHLGFSSGVMPLGVPDKDVSTGAFPV